MDNIWINSSYIDEILLKHILKEIPENERYKYRRVCKRWKYVIDEYTLIKMSPKLKSSDFITYCCRKNLVLSIIPAI